MDIKKILSMYHDEEASAHAAGLVYVSDAQPGYTRQRVGTGFTYKDDEGVTVKDVSLRSYFEDLVIPPAWDDVWICSQKKGHLLVTGHDVKGRKQYIYHPKWRAMRDMLNSYRMVLFGKELAHLRKHVDKDLGSKGLNERKMCALVVSLMDQTLIRVGHAVYTRDNESYGLTTLNKNHVEQHGKTIEFEFRGKSGKEQDIILKDRRLARIISQSMELPGKRLFEYTTHEGEVKPVTAYEVNAYIHSHMKHDFSSKDFRTWGGTLACFTSVIAQLQQEDDKEAYTQKVTSRKKILKDGIQAAAEKLGNTAAVCKKHYIHHDFQDSVVDGTFLDFIQKKRYRESAYMHSDEKYLLDVLDVLIQTSCDKSLKDITH